MLKRLYSKRSGFTLAEIVVAIAIFAVMTTMVAGILQATSLQRRRNNEYGQELADQEQLIAQITKDANDYTAEFAADADYEAGKYELSFQKKDTTGTLSSETYEAKLAYAVKAADGTNSPEGLNYFVSPVAYDGVVSNNGSSGNSGSNGGQVGGGNAEDSAEYTGSLASSLADVRICASRGMEYVQIMSIDKVGTPSDGAAVRYVFKTKANSGTSMSAQQKAYAEYRLYFFMDGKLDVIQSSKVIKGFKNDGTEFEYTQDVPLAAQVVAAGYCNSDGNPISHSTGAPTVRTSGGNTVRIGVAFRDDGGSMDTNNNFAGKGFSGEVTTFYVDFKEDPNITVASFGDNGDSSGKFTKYNIPVGTNSTYNNVFMYGGFMYVMRDPVTKEVITSL